MAYCRWGDSDLYIYHQCSGGIVCTDCSEVFHKRSEVIEHIRMHERDGWEVPSDLIGNLEKEIEDIGDDVTDVIGEFA
jgi:hypothetical protein